MTEIGRDRTSNNAEGEDPLPLPPTRDEDAPIIDRAIEAGKDLPPIGIPVQKAIGRSALSERPASYRLHPAEKAYVAEKIRPMLRRHVEGPRAA